MKRDIDAILIDIDDCLIPTNGKTFPDFFAGLEEIAHYVERSDIGLSPKIAFCTGRDRNYVEAIASVVGLPNWWSIIESGVALFNPTTKELLINDALQPEAKEAFDIIRRDRLPMLLRQLTELSDYPGNMINIALERRHGIETPIEELYESVKSMVSDLATEGLITVHHSTVAVDISPAGIDKASGIAFLCKKTGIAGPEKLLGIGDSKGDFPMLTVVGYAGCPANASVECKKLITQRQGYISPFEYAYGVLDIIRHFTGIRTI